MGKMTNAHSNQSQWWHDMVSRERECVIVCSSAFVSGFIQVCGHLRVKRLILQSHIDVISLG
jgi:hypothetical protein